jgi:hypothetical protein
MFRRFPVGRALVLFCLVSVTACVTVRPEQRAVLADPVMRPDDEADEREALQHALENREGSYGGGSVRGGGCGCN